MNILLVSGLNADHKYTGVESYRMVEPHVALMKYQEGYKFEYCPVAEWDLENRFSQHHLPHEERIEFLKGIIKDRDLVIFNREIYPMALQFLKDNNVKFALDLDDYWILPGDHPLKDHYDNQRESILNSIRGALFVTTSTEPLAEKIREYNQNVYLLENGLFFDKWTPNKTESNRLRFGFTQGSTHFYDLKPLFTYIRASMKEYDFKTKCQIVHCGFAVPEKDHPSFTWKQTNVSQVIELEMTGGMKLLNRTHASALYRHEQFADLNEPYRRINALDIDNFQKVYDEFDISVFTLRDKVFNSCKSNIKILEAATKGCAVMCSTRTPYDLANDKNSFSLEKKNFREWYKYLLKNPNLVTETRERLRSDVERFDLKHLSIKRNKIYKKYGV